MKAGVIGAGPWGKNIVKNLHALGKLGGVAESDATLAATLAEQYPGVPIFSSAEDLLDTDISAVCIATPAHTHHAIAKLALEAAKDVLVEKPMVLSSGEAEDLVRIATKGNRILMVGHLLLYQPAIRFIKQTLNSGLIGEVYSFHQDRLNLGRARNKENALWSFGVHDVAVLLYLADSGVKDVQFFGHCGLQRHIEDDTFLHLSFSNGSVAHVHSSWLWPEVRRQLTIVGSSGMLVYDELKQTVVHVKKSIDQQLKNVDDGAETIYEGSGEPLKLELEHFMDCVETRRTPISDGASGVEVVRVLEMASRGLSLV